MQALALPCKGHVGTGGVMQNESWVTFEAIVGHLGVSKDTVHRWIRARNIPVHRVGRQWRFKVSEVDA